MGLAETWEDIDGGDGSSVSETATHHVAEGGTSAFETPQGGDHQVNIVLHEEDARSMGRSP